MWARVVEMMLGCWLIVSPWIFRHPTYETALWWIDIASGSLVVIFALFSFWERTYRAHLGTVLLALALGLFGRFAMPPEHVAAQNHVTVALLLLMLAIIPTEASRPPLKWREHYTARGGAG
jgi:hypothetical protein